MFSRVQTTLILASAKPASRRLASARMAVSYEPGPRTRSLTSAVAPSRETCTSTYPPHAGEARNAARSGVIRTPLVENFTPTWWLTAYSSRCQKSGRIVGSPPPMLT